MKRDDGHRAACAGQWWLFDSTELDHHLEAREHCATCPLLANCRQNVPPKTDFIDGTWAGHLYRDGRQLNVPPRVEPRPCKGCGGDVRHPRKEYHDRCRQIAKARRMQERRAVA